VSIDALIGRLREAVKALRGDGYLDTNKVSFIALSRSGGSVERVEIVSSAYRQIEMMKRGLVGPLPAPIPYSPRYLRWRIRKGLGSTPTWTLVRRGVLYRSLGYFVKGGELYVEYDTARKNAVRYLSQRAGFNVLDVPKPMLAEMAKAMHAVRLQRFVDAIRGSYGEGKR